MAIGLWSGQMLATDELEAGTVRVSVGGDVYEVSEVMVGPEGSATVTLVPLFGHPWPLEVCAEDLTEPMWEVAN